MDRGRRGHDRPDTPALHVEYVTCRNYEEVATAIRDMIIRGAPAIGVAAAMGVAIGVQYASEADLDAQVDVICGTLARTRPTAVNLFWAIDRMKRLYTTLRGKPLGEIRERLIQEAQLVREEDIAISRASESTARRWFGPQNGAHALQCRRSGHRGVRYGVGRDPRGSRERQADRCLRR
jgi:methylthioribose-1-phosphate isomerase